MKIKVIGKAHREGVAKKTGNPYNFNQIHYTGPDRGVEGLAALVLNLDPSLIPYADIKNLYSQPLNAVWTAFFPPYCVAFPCNPSGLLRKTSLSDEKNPRPSSIPRL